MLWMIVRFRRDHVKGIDEGDENRKLATHVISDVAVERIILLMSGLFEAISLGTQMADFLLRLYSGHVNTNTDTFLSTLKRWL